MALFVNIKKTFPDFELAAQLECEHEVFALLGESGCGKSLTLKCIAGIEKPDYGEILINGVTVFNSETGVNLPPQKRRIGFLFQNYALFPNMTVFNNIYCVIKKPKAEKMQIVSDIIKSFQLEGVKNLYPRQISGGQQQRTALARILVSSPDILMLDEPFSALDSYLKWEMEQEITSVLEVFCGTTILVTHDRKEAYRISDRMGVMSNGRIQMSGEKETLFNAPTTLSTAIITGCKNISEAKRVDAYTVYASDWGVSLKTHAPVPDNIKYIGVHSHHVEFANNKDMCNSYMCLIQRVIEEPFEKTLVFSFSNSNNAAGKLYFQVSKDKWRDNRIKDCLLYIPSDRIMCLT